MNTTEVTALLILAGIVALLIWKGGLKWWYAAFLLAIGFYLGGSSIGHFATTFTGYVDGALHWIGHELSSLSKGKH